VKTPKTETRSKSAYHSGGNSPPVSAIVYRRKHTILVYS
jgi:hypothetical protein